MFWGVRTCSLHAISLIISHIDDDDVDDDNNEFSVRFV